MNITWHNEKRRIRDLIPYVANPRQITDKQAKDLKASLDKFGVADPIIINTDNTIIGGHQRKKILETLMGVDPDFEIDVRVPERELSIDEARELNVRLNKNMGQWDFDVLANNFELDDLLDWGFEKSDLDLDLWMPDPPDDAEPQIDRAEELREIWGVETGQLWRLGEHRLICGDCTDKAVVERVMGGEMATICFTSPPYWVGKSYETQDSIEAIDEFIHNVVQMLNYAVKKDKSRIIINTSTGFTTSFNKRKKRQVLLLIDKWTNELYALGWNLRHVRHWLKEGQLSSTAPKTDLIDQHCEFLGTYENDNGEDIVFDDWIDENIGLLGTFYNTSGTTRGQERTGKKWALRAYWDDIKGNANDNNHCAAFPLELVERHLALYTKPDEIVYEPFSGSGTTIIGCERFGRQCRAIELDPGYCAVAIQRWVDVTGGEPELVED